MKPPILILLLTATTILYAQPSNDSSGIFYKIAIATTLGINEDYTLLNDNDDTFIEPSAIFINNTLGYRFDQKSSLGVNLEYDYHSESNLNFVPLHLSFQYNIIADDLGFFIRSSYGKFLNLGDHFEKGTLYKIGLGLEGFNDQNSKSTLFGVELTQKRFGFRQTEKLTSISLFLELKIL